MEFPSPPRLPEPPLPPEPGVPRRWPLGRRSLAASALVHAAILAALLGLWRMAPPPDEPLVPVRVVIEGPGAAGAAGGAGGGDQAAAAEPAEPTPPQETAETAPPPARQAAEPLPPRHKPKPVKPQAAARPTPAPTTEVPPPEPPPVEVAVVPLPEPAPGTPGTGGGPSTGDGAGQGAAGAGQGAVGDGPAGSPGDDYLERVRRWIKQFQHYPREATRQKQEGTALLDVTLARDGTVLGVALERSSGYPLLDQAAIKAVLDASPVPAFPPAYRPEQGTMVLPAQYRLGTFERLF